VLMRTELPGCTVLCAHHELPSQAQLEALHWLPVRQRIVFKIAVLTYKSLNTQQPAYLHCLLYPYQPSCTLHSACQNLLQILLVNINFGRCSFSCALAEIWNNLPDTVKDLPFFTTFITRLKSHLFNLINKY